MDFESDIVENGLEFMAMDMGTQPTSLNSILESQNLDSGSFIFWFLHMLRVLKPQTVFLQFYLINLGRE